MQAAYSQAFRTALFVLILAAATPCVWGTTGTRDGPWITEVPIRIGVSLEPTLAWTPGFGTMTVNVYVFEGLVVSSDAEVFAAEGLTADMVTIPQGVLNGNTTYTWFVTALNEVGFSGSEEQTFTTEAACLADIDGDGDADVADFFAFVAAFEAGDPLADLNGDGSVDTLDFFAFVAAFAEGCP